MFLVGHDIGTQVAYSYAAEHPMEVKITQDSRILYGSLYIEDGVFSLTEMLRMS
jgi:pimeloyl-ACP methyl ester carboxylesterase